MSHEDVKNALGADFVIPFAATSHYAVPITQEWLTHSHLEPIVADGENVIYCQVDVHACADKEEWELIRFMHGYGDVGMILGLIARNYGFSLGTSGLKVRHLLQSYLRGTSVVIACMCPDTCKNGQPAVPPHIFCSLDSGFLGVIARHLGEGIYD